MIKEAETDGAETNAPEEQQERRRLWTISAEGFSATADAFAIGPETQGECRDIWFLLHAGTPDVGEGRVGRPRQHAAQDHPHDPRGRRGWRWEEGYIRCQIPHTSQGTWTTRLVRMENGMGYHAMVYSRMAEYAFDREDFVMLAREEEEAPDLHYRFLNRRVSVPLHDSWAQWLWERALEKDEATPLECTGIAAWRCIPNTAGLQNDLATAIREGRIGIPDRPESS